MKFCFVKRQALRRSFQEFVVRTAVGAVTRVALRGNRKRGSYRGSGGRDNSKKCPELGFHLLQYFVDRIQNLYSRTDSMAMLKQARQLREFLVQDGYPEYRLPKLVGNAGSQWFRRWRIDCGINYKISGMELKVSWEKIVRQVKVLFTNMFRIRHFWEYCHPGKPMRWFSLDQKPSWFNNVGHRGTLAKKGGPPPGIKENFNQTRVRYTILTSVRSWGNEDPKQTPPMLNVETCVNLHHLIVIKKHVVDVWLIVKLDFPDMEHVEFTICF